MKNEKKPTFQIDFQLFPKYRGEIVKKLKKIEIST